MNKYIILLFFFFFTPLFSQEVETLPMGFRDITIGLNMDEAKIAIENDGYFDYRGDPDVSMLMSDEKSIIESRGNFYIENGYFQFYNSILYTITLVLDTGEVDYYTMFTTLKNKYGKYSSLTPKMVVWENDNIRISLEKPLTIKYVGLGVFNELIEEDVTKEAARETLRKEFINEF